MARRIDVVAYNEKWPAMYEAEAGRLREVFGADLVAIHHIGSTAVPGLAAKPIIDIMVVISDIRRIGEFDAGMIGLGYRVRGECLDDLGTPGRFYFSKDTDGVRTHQAHVMQAGHHEIREKLAFRDYLRAHPHEAAAYAEIKQRLAAENTRGIVEYIEGKDAFVKQTIGKAKTWAGQPDGRVKATNDLVFLASLMGHLEACGIAAWVFGGWAEELLGIRPAGPHGDVDLLYPAADFKRVDSLIRGWPEMVEIRQKRFSHKRAAEFRGVRVEFFLLQPEGQGHVTRFFDGRFVYGWPEDTLATATVGVGEGRVHVASERAVRSYRDVRLQVMAAMQGQGQGGDV